METWLGFLGDEASDRKVWPITRYIIEQLILPKVLDNLSLNSSVPEPMLHRWTEPPRLSAFHGRVLHHLKANILPEIPMSISFRWTP